ncbi:MAG TPA: cation diffusion facilitator family transporter [Gemmataceae bacterium]|nr:cation diffusion facilitator family transporter [Gemmataceae bacterium]
MPEQNLRRLMVLSIVAAVVTMALKLVGYWLTGSVGMLSDALETVLNVFAALAASFSLWYAALPVDVTHTYGHRKIEYFSSGLEGALILGAAVAIAWYAVHRLLVPERPEAIVAGAVVLVVSSAINLAVARVLIRVGRANDSIVLEADGRHLMADVWTSAAVLAGLVLVRVTGLVWFDPAVALLVAVNIARTGIGLMRRSFNGLMDHSLPAEEQARVRAAIAAQLQPGMDYHALRTRQAGADRFADFHLLVPGRLTVSQAHALTNRIEEAVQAALPGIEVTVHVEPIEERAAWEDSALVPLEQAARRAEAERQQERPPQG